MSATSEVVEAAVRKRVADETSGAPQLSCASSEAHLQGCEEADRVATSAAHIRVAVRVRPAPPGDDSIIEVAGRGAIAVRKEAATGGNEFLKSQRGRTEERMFDRVFGPDASQEEVYEWCGRPLINSAVEEGRSATVFVYGATSAGKTHTMFGEREGEQRGLIYRAVQEVFDVIARRVQSGLDSRPLEAKLSFLDIYNENVRDLLQEGNALCKVLEDERRGLVKVANLRELPVRSAEEALRLLRVGLQARKVEATAANAWSSRSHAVLQLTLERVESALPGPGNPIFQRRGQEQRKLHTCISLIDLAGSERGTQTQNRGSALKDGAKINQSLLALANCIDALVYKPGGTRDGSQSARKKPPYRDSKLTLLLKGSLMSDCLVSMIANVHPGRDHFEDSNNTLEYAKRASIVKAPAVVRRQRAVSMPTSRPPSESPPSSPVPCTRDVAPLAQAGTLKPKGTASSDAIGRGEPAVVPKRRRTLEGRPPAIGNQGDTDDDADTTPRLQACGAEPPPSRLRPLSVVRRPGVMGTSELPAQRRGSCCAPASWRSAPSEFSPDGSEMVSLQDAESCSPSEQSERLLMVPCTTTTEQPASPLPISPKVHQPTPSCLTTQTSHMSLCSLDAEAQEVNQWRLHTTPPSSSEAPSAEKLVQRPTRRSASPRKGRSQRPATHSPPCSRRPVRSNSDWPKGLHASPGGMTTAQHISQLLRIVESLHAEKASLNARVDRLCGDNRRLEADNAQLRAENLEKDRQLAVALASLHGDTDLSPCSWHVPSSP